MTRAARGHAGPGRSSAARPASARAGSSPSSRTGRNDGLRVLARPVRRSSTRRRSRCCRWPTRCAGSPRTARTTSRAPRWASPAARSPRDRRHGCTRRPRPPRGGGRPRRSCWSIEDVHWADRSTLELLGYLARRLRDERILVVATYRSDEVDRRERPARASSPTWQRPRAVQRLALDRLTRADMREQLAGILGEAAAAGAARGRLRARGGQRVLRRGAARGRHGERRRPAGDAARHAAGAHRHARRQRARRWCASPPRADGRCTTGCWRRRRACPSPSCPPRCATPCATTCSSRWTTATPSATRCARGRLRRAAPGRACATCTPRSPRRSRSGRSSPHGNDATVAAEIAHHWLRAGDEPRALAAAVRAGTQAERRGRSRRGRGPLRACPRAVAAWSPIPSACWRGPRHPAGPGGERHRLRGPPREAVGMLDEALALVDAAAEPARAAVLHKQRGLHLCGAGRGRESVAGLRARRRAHPGRAAFGGAGRRARGAGPQPHAL